MAEQLNFLRVEFRRFKAFKSFTLHLRHFSIMVGPNNAGKSTILAAFRILAAGLRTANNRRAQMVEGPEGRVLGYPVDLGTLSIAEENIFHNYGDTDPASVTFFLTDNKKLLLHFPEADSCNLIAQGSGSSIGSPKRFRSEFNCPVGFVPILGPVEHRERLYGKEAARLALFNYRAARNFRNIWHHYPEDFELFQSTILKTWPGMEIERPELDTSHDKPVLHMYCRENRITREICWAGFGFQVWCQMLTHLVKSRSSSIFLIDEPDIYLHSDLQRQLLNLLAGLGPDVLVATHSTEIVSEAEANQILLIDKRKRSSKRLTDPAQLSKVFSGLGSSLNPILTQLARTRRVVFVEGKDFQVFSNYARKLHLDNVSSRSGFAVIPIAGFNPDRAQSLKRGIEATLGDEIRAAVVLDRDFRSDLECDAIETRCREFCELAVIHGCKEVESFLLVPEAIDRAAGRRVKERAQQAGESLDYTAECAEMLAAFAEKQKNRVMSRFIASRRRYVRKTNPAEAEETTNQAALEAFEADWAKGLRRRLQLVPAKAALSTINSQLQQRHCVSVTATAIINAVHVDEIPAELRDLLRRLDAFATG